MALEAGDAGASGRGRPLPPDPEAGRRLMAMARRRGFVWPAFEIYGASAGLWDYGPQGSAMLHNLTELWRRYFIVQEGSLEVSCPAVTPEDVFIASGHVEEFTDFMVDCPRCDGHFRADHLVEDHHPNPDALSLDELADVMREAGVKCPSCGGPLSRPHAFNLMFTTTLGPGSKKTAYLRPETAQGIFINFREMYRQNRERIPFAVVQQGRGYRNEISPRQGMIRLREFQMSELEYFVHPDEPVHSGFPAVAGVEVPLLPRDGGERTMALGRALEEGVIGNEALAYFMGRTHQFLIEAGVDPARLRFRQHTDKEMAHYANDCWDAEILLAIGWTELVGIADRSCYDLTRHSEHTTTEMVAVKKYAEPVRRERKKLEPKMKMLGPVFKGEAGKVRDAMEAMTESQVEGLDPSAPLQVEVPGGVGGKDVVEVPPDAFDVVTETVVESGDSFTPRVIEPSFGMDRLFYTVLEHCYREYPEDSGGGEAESKGEDGAEGGEEAETAGDVGDAGVYRVLALSPSVAPISCGVFPLVRKPPLAEKAREIARSLKEGGLTSYYDEGGTIGRRYARMDEVGTPFCVTVDFDSLETGKVTLRDRDSCRQVLIDAGSVDVVVRELVGGRKRFAEL